MDPRDHLSFCACNTAWLANKILVSIGTSHYLWFLQAKQRLLDQNNKSLWVPDIPCRFVNAKIGISTRITSPYGSQPSSVVFACKTATFGRAYKTPWVSDLTCLFVHANSVPSIRNTSLYGSPPLSVLLCMQNSDFWTSIQVSMGTRPHLSFCACKTAWLVPELLVSIGSIPHLWFCAFKPATLGPKLYVSMGLRPHLWISACKTACLTSELLVFIGPSPNPWFLHAKELLDPNNKSLWVPEITCRFVHAIQRD